MTKFTTYRTSLRSIDCFLFSTLLLLVACVPALAQETETESSPAAGSWKWKSVSLSGEIDCRIFLVEKDGKLTGMYSDEGDLKAEVGDVKVDDDKISFVIVVDNDGTKSEIKFNGKLAGDKITGKMIDGGSERDWKAERFISLQEVVGKWRLSFTTPDGETRNPEFELKIDNGKPEIEFDAGVDDAEGVEISDLKFKNGLLLFKIALDFQGQELSLDYELEFMNVDELEGSMYFEFKANDMNGDVDVTGQRSK